MNKLEVMLLGKFERVSNKFYDDDVTTKVCSLPSSKDDPTTSEIFLVFQELKETEVSLQVHVH